ncbi:MAG: leucine-rich repeat protein [Clostridia bacterium]
MDKFIILLRSKAFKITISILLVLILVVTGILVILINRDNIIVSQKQVFFLYLEGFDERNIEKVAEALFPKDSDEYNDFIINNGDLFDNIDGEPPLGTLMANGTLDRFEPLTNGVSYRIFGYYNENYITIYPTFYKHKGRWYLNDNFGKQSAYEIHSNSGPNPRLPILQLTQAEKADFANNNGVYKRYVVESGKEISSNTFRGCTYLNEIVLPSNIKNIHAGWFGDCKNLVAITFDGTPANFVSKDGVVYTKNQKTLVVFPLGKGMAQGSPEGEFHIPSTVTTIGEYAFTYYSGQIKKIVFPSSVKVIGEGAFNRAFNASNYSVELNDGLEKIGSSAFDSVLLSQITIPQSVTEIGSEAFMNAANLYQIDFHPNSALKSIGYAAFENAENLLEITIPKGVTKIDNWLFRNCYRLHTVVLHNNVKSIGRSSFEKCYSLNELYIPKSVTGVGISAFQAAYNTTLYIEAPSQPSGWNTAWNMGYSQTPVWGVAFPKS